MGLPYWVTAGYDVNFHYENYERIADFIRRCKGHLMVSISDLTGKRRVLGGSIMKQSTLAIAARTSDRV